MSSKICLILFLLLLCYCNQNTALLNKETTTQGNISTTVSSDIDKLALFLNFKTFRPVKTKFKHTVINNSGNNDRLSVPGPSDEYLQAILYFDSATFKKLSAAYSSDSTIPNLQKQNFNFEWLDQSVKKELTDTTLRGTPDHSFGPNCELFFLNNKLLLQCSSN